MKRFTKLALSFVFLCQGAVFAQSAEQKGLKIAQDMEKANIGYLGESSQMRMVLIDAYGAKTTRLMEGLVKEVEGDGDKSLSVFLNPQDVKGTLMLTWSHKEADDDQWLFLPSVRRVKRINSSNQSSSFMGSEFSYEDLGSQELEKYDFKLIRDDKVEKEAVWVLERVPKKKSGYSKMTMYVSKKMMNPVKVDYYDRKGELLKTGIFSEFKAYKVGKKTLYRASSIHMKNVQTKKESLITWDKRELGINHPERSFDQAALK
jgi:hypothetical protein